MRFAPSAAARIAVISGVLMLGIGPAPASSGQDARPVSTTPSDVLAQSVGLITSGQFEAAESHLPELEQLGDPGQRVAHWLREHQEMEKTRQELTLADLKKYVGWVKEQHAKGNIENAVAAAVRAYDNAADRDAFRAQPWLGELYEDALIHAAGLREERKWLEAHAVYYQLAEIFEHDKDINKLRRECLTHARLDVSYKPEGKWRDYLAGIEPNMLENALYKIDKYYVTDADFREMAIAGLEQLVILGESATLAKVFESLTDEVDREEFTQRLEARIDQAKTMTRFGYRDTASLFRRALRINRQTVQLPEELLVSEFMAAAMDTLDDFSSIIWPVEFREFDKHTRGDFIGVGISISEVNGQITVVTPLEDSPAYYAGIVANDVITKVDGQTTEGMSLTQAVEIITGPIDTTVTLAIRRPHVDEELEFKLKRARVTIQSVKGIARNAKDPQKWDHLIDSEMGIGYLRVGAFQSNTVAHLQQTVQEMIDAKPSLAGLILDLRYNPGGLLTSAVNMSELFLEKGDRIVSTKGPRVREWPIPAERTGPFLDLPLIVLINGQSASASEIVSGALRDHKRAVIIGERTFGKFSVQNLMQLGNSEAHLKLTTAAYYLPSGQSLHRTEDATVWGVDPNIKVALVPKERARVRLMRIKSNVLNRPDLAKADDNGTEDAAEAKPEDAAPDQKPAEEDDAKASEAKDTDQPAEVDADSDEAEAKKSDDVPKEELLPSDTNDFPEIDPQLETALLVMRAQLLGQATPQIAYQGAPADVEVK
ncbi:MAG: S41 family peptidase [Phycisphaerae bacterium]